MEIREQKSIDDMDAPSQAQEFVDKIIADGRIPDLTNVKLARKLHVRGFGFYWNDQGHYKLSFVDFEDESSWEKGKAHA